MGGTYPTIHLPFSRVKSQVEQLIYLKIGEEWWINTQVNVYKGLRVGVSPDRLKHLCQ